jgi:hypothetical protein
VNKELSEDRFDGYLEFLDRAIVAARLAALDGDLDRCEEIVDVIHKLPSFLLGRERRDFEARYFDSAVKPLVTKYPDLDDLTDLLPKSRGK